ncbi:hypothetical protein LSM04_004433 [Trypanosoma melophagium]|uniref:uncharacterized protein n=1 Tax=Trypanosoma melophagium TaxID=715481 RepID=UPI00351A9582|nr:hypothetical protein LSM04_004433 [Trypanosoma melophagium]
MRENVFFTRLLERVAAVPHRSIAAVPYGEWFTLYIQALKSAQASMRNANNNSNNNNNIAATLHAGRCDVDAALLSSVVSRSWTDVDLQVDNNNNNNNQNKNHSSSWWWADKTTSNTTTNNKNNDKNNESWLHPTCEAGARELVTTSFLREPLLAGRSLTIWTEAVKEAGGKEESSKAKIVPAVVVVVPFTALLQLRTEAYPQNCKSSNKEQEQQDQHRGQISLQERSARMSTIHSLHYLMEMQSSSMSKSSIKVVVWSPVNEFDAIMQISKVRMTLPEPVRNLFSLTQVCENETIRTAYLCHYLSLITKGSPLSVLAPQREYRSLQKMGIDGSSIKSHPNFLEVNQKSSTTSTGISLHSKAVNSCGKLARRMSTREDNLRHILIP